MATLKERLKEILLRDQLVSADDFEIAVKEQKKTGEPLNKILVRLKLIKSDVLTQVLSESLELPPINISHLKIAPDVVRLIPKALAKKYHLLPISLIGDHLTLAMVDPLDVFAIDNIKALTGCNISPVICPPEALDDVINSVYATDESSSSQTPDEVETFDEIMKDIHDTEDVELIKDIEGGEKSGNEVEEIKDEAPIIKLTDSIIQQAVVAKASDVFIEPLERATRVRYRVDGMIREIDRLAKVIHNPLISRIKVISNLDISEHRLPQDGRFKTVTAKGKAVDFRVNVLPTATGEKIVLRVLDQSGTVLDLDNLGFDPSSLSRLKECAVKPHGMILTCGPTGSGKTTTLYSCLKYVDSPEKNIVTVEDPVEYQMKGMNQVNIKPAMGLTFPTALRSILRQDPDIIMIGEIRDSDTLNIAIKAALTGHLVLSSLHTTTAAGSVVRMMNMGVEPFLICSSVLAIIAQRLIRRICPHCKEKYTVPDPVVEKFKLQQYFDTKKIEMERGKGCEKCLKIGYSGRVGIHEILTLTPKIRESILKNEGEITIKTKGREEGMITMREDALRKAVQGLTTLEEVLRVTAPDEEARKK